LPGGRLRRERQRHRLPIADGLQPGIVLGLQIGLLLMDLIDGRLDLVFVLLQRGVQPGDLGFLCLHGFAGGAVRLLRRRLRRFDVGQVALAGGQFGVEFRHIRLGAQGPGLGLVKGQFVLILADLFEGMMQRIERHFGLQAHLFPGHGGSAPAAPATP
jgi:hypothetical protein